MYLIGFLCLIHMEFGIFLQYMHSLSLLCVLKEVLGLILFDSLSYDCNNMMDHSSILSIIIINLYNLSPSPSLSLSLFLIVFFYLFLFRSSNPIVHPLTLSSFHPEISSRF
jgi:hypothetical protein